MSVEVGSIVEGWSRDCKFGAFVELPGGVTGLVHFRSSRCLREGC